MRAETIPKNFYFMIECVDNRILVGDGFCDDVVNTAKCDYDCGDCCGGSTILCTDCICHGKYLGCHLGHLLCKPDSRIMMNLDFLF